MKKYLLILLLCSSLFCQAQSKNQPKHDANILPYSHGSWLVGSQVGYSNGLRPEQYLSVQACGGYFIASNVWVGLVGTWSREHQQGIQTEAWLTGPGVRYQFTRTRFSPFVVGSYQLGQLARCGPDPITTTQTTPIGIVVATSGLNTKPRFIYSRSVAVGVTMKASSALGVDFALGWQDKVESGGSYNSWQPQIGLNYQLANKH
ncbi:hypothetical protein [Spirosoma sordidisoli]|uniref:Outer membrane protein beta-barrel domain-containing protein n=1 Tax=Spirosoma sordidisoli TaxID=2502893 RepID=A0A4Q2UQY3_9BACT|nr:hypothetical protein [Spirosoma sordidisoli]RYC70075.1 hypothetical protein EQG79_09395 [Spirosoma sordidisoli]